MVEKALNRLAVFKMGANNLRCVLSTDTYVEHTLGFNNYTRALLTEAVTVATANFYRGIF
jgi:hypothetical protein